METFNSNNNTQSDVSDHRPANDFTLKADMDKGVELPEERLAGKDVRAARLEHLLFETAPGEAVYISKDLKLQGRHEVALITARSNESGEFEIWNGMPSRTGTRINGQLIEAAALVKPGESFQIGSSLITIPINSREAKTDLLKDIFTLKVGEALPIGRYYYRGEIRGDGTLPHQLSVHTSRQHCTLLRAEDAIDSHGKPQRVYQLVDGIHGSEKLFLDTDDGNWEAFEGKVTVGPGRKIKIGESGPSVEVPDPFRDFDASLQVKGKVDSSLSQESIEHSISEYAASRSEIFGRNLNSLSFRAPEDLNSMERQVTVAQAQFLGLHIKEGLNHIATENYAAAIAHFENASVLQACGFTLGEGNVFGRKVPEVTGAIIHEVLEDVAARSWFFPGSRTVQPSFGFIHKATWGEAPQSVEELSVDILRSMDNIRRLREEASPALTEKETALLKEFNREICLIYAEEWTHAYQHALGMLVSKKGALLNSLPQSLRYAPLEEFDVREFFGERKVPLSPMYTARYGRDEAHDILRSYATREEKTAIRSLLALADVGETLSFGSGVSGRARSGTYTISTEVPEELTLEQQLCRTKYLTEQIRPDHLKITPKGAGQYEVAPTAPYSTDGKVFMLDRYRIWRPVYQTQEFPAGTRIRIGTSFEFKLP